MTDGHAQVRDASSPTLPGPSRPEVIERALCGVAFTPSPPPPDWRLEAGVETHALLPADEPFGGGVWLRVGTDLSSAARRAALARNAAARLAFREERSAAVREAILLWHELRRRELQLQQARSGRELAALRLGHGRLEHATGQRSAFELTQLERKAAHADLALERALERVRRGRADLPPPCPAAPVRGTGDALESDWSPLPPPPTSAAPDHAPAVVRARLALGDAAWELHREERRASGRLEIGARSGYGGSYADLSLDSDGAVRAEVGWRVDDGSAGTELTVALAVPLSSDSAALASARDRLERTTRELDDARRDARRNAERRRDDVDWSRALRRIAAAALADARAAVRAMAERSARGLAASEQLLEAELERLARHLALIDAQEGEDRALLALHEAVGSIPGTPP